MEDALFHTFFNAKNGKWRKEVRKERRKEDRKKEKRKEGIRKYRREMQIE